MIKYEYIENGAEKCVMTLSINKYQMNDMFNCYKNDYNYSILYDDNHNKFNFSKYSNILIHNTLKNNTSKYIIHSCNKAFINSDIDFDKIQDNKYYVGRNIRANKEDMFNVVNSIEYIRNSIKLKSPIFHFKRFLIMPFLKWYSQTGPTYLNVMPLNIMTANTLRCQEYRFNEIFHNGLEDNLLSYRLQNKIEPLDFTYFHIPATTFKNYKHSKLNNYGNLKDLRNNLYVFSKEIEKIKNGIK